MNDTLKFMIVMIIFVVWLWKFGALYNRYQDLDERSSQLIQAVYVIKNYKITGYPVTDLSDVNNKDNLVIPEWNGTDWVYYHIPLKKIIIKIK